MKMNRLWIQLGIILIAFAGILYIAQNCKPSRSLSDVQSLDNFAAGEVVNRNMCSASPDRFGAAIAKAFDVRIDSKMQSGAEVLFQETMIALSAVPSRVLEEFSRFNGKVIVADEPSKYCGPGLADDAVRRFAAEGAQAVESCFLVTMPGNRPANSSVAPFGQRMVVILGANVSTIRHATVRQFGYMYSQVFSRLRRVPNDPTGFVLTHRTREDTIVRDAIARAFLIDVAQSGIFDFSGLYPFLGDNAKKVVDSHLAELKAGQDVAAYNEFSFAVAGSSGPADKLQRHQFVERFKDFVVAEAFDSYFCNAWSPYTSEPINQARMARNPKLLAGATNSRKLMSELFSQTFTAFAPVARQLEPQRGLGLTGDAGAEDESLNLAGPNQQETQTWAQWVGSTASYINRNYNPAQIAVRKVGEGLESSGNWLVNNGWSGTAKVVAGTGGFVTGFADSTDQLGAGLIQTVANPAEAYDNYYTDSYNYTGRVISNQERTGSQSPISSGLALSSFHLVGPGKITEGVQGQLFDGTVVNDPLERIALVNTGVAQTTSYPLMFQGGVQLGNQLAFKAGVPQLATKSISQLAGRPAAIAPEITKVWGNPAAIDAANVRPWEWADEAAGKIKLNPTIQEMVPDSTGIAKQLNLQPGKNYIYGVVEDANAPLGYKWRVAEEVPIVKVGDNFKGLGHPTLTADGARPLFGGDLLVDGNGGITLTNKSGRIVGNGAAQFPQRAGAPALDTAVNEFASNTGAPIRGKYFDTANPKLPDGSFKAPVISNPVEPIAASNGTLPAAAGAAGQVIDAPEQ